MASVTPDPDLEPPKKRFRFSKVSFFQVTAFLLHFNIQQISTEIAQSFTCTVDGCNRCYSRADTLRLHMKQAHDKDVTQKKPRFLCPMSECDKSLFHATQLTKHMKETHKVEVGKLQRTRKYMLSIYSILILISNRKL